MFDYQTYPKDKRELIILDDSPESNQDIIDQYKKNNNIRYIHSPEKLALGKKRNMLNSLVKGEYIMCMDDDDYYPPEKITYTIARMRAKKAVISGSSEMYLYFTKQDKIYRFERLGQTHATNGTFTYHKSFLKEHKYEDTAMMAEEKYFLNNYKDPILQIEPLKSIICIAHDKNTFDKNRIVDKLTPLNIKMKDVVKDKKIMNFYKTLSQTVSDAGSIQNSTN
jgi:glycosyltransferase involved in cell wall biosynthesis